MCRIIKNLKIPTRIFTIPIREILGGTPNSVACLNGIVAVAVEIVDETTGNQPAGVVAFFQADLAQVPQASLKTITVGVLPDMLTFTPDGTKIIVTNECEPSEAERSR